METFKIVRILQTQVKNNNEQPKQKSYNPTQVA